MSLPKQGCRLIYWPAESLQGNRATGELKIKKAKQMVRKGKKREMGEMFDGYVMRSTYYRATHSFA